MNIQLMTIAEGMQNPFCSYYVENYLKKYPLQLNTNSNKLIVINVDATDKDTDASALVELLVHHKVCLVILAAETGTENSCTNCLKTWVLNIYKDLLTNELYKLIDTERYDEMFYTSYGMMNPGLVYG